MPARKSGYILVTSRLPSCSLTHIQHPVRPVDPEQHGDRRNDRLDRGFEGFRFIVIYEKFLAFIPEDTVHRHTSALFNGDHVHKHTMRTPGLMLKELGDCGFLKHLTEEFVILFIGEATLVTGIATPQ